MTKQNEQKVKFLDIQLIAIAGFIIALLISLLLTYDKKLSLENKKRLFSEEDAQNLAMFQTVLVFIIAIGFLYINYEQYTIAKKYHDKDEQDLFLQTETAVLALISAIVGLYIVFKNYRGKNLSIAETELF
ncbi:MAG: hypothetical protein U0M66_04555 [Bacilli bacterium]|nr:hypothetical protein [Bacilli bacterium]